MYKNEKDYIFGKELDRILDFIQDAPKLRDIILKCFGDISKNAMISKSAQEIRIPCKSDVTVNGEEPILKSNMKNTGMLTSVII